MKHHQSLDKLITQLILVTILATAVGLFYPLTSVTFGPWYGSIAKHIAETNNWTNLVLSNQDWLDKPHFPFWVTAFSFKIFGINSFAYILPGFIFHLIGALYTYKLTNYLYKNHTLALLATLIYLSTFHLMISAIDVRAEAYLLGQIMPAIYYWLHYDQKSSWKSLFFGAFFTGLALMTKGIFVIITIVSGLFCLWVYTRRLGNLISPKWWLALLLAFIFALPELIALYVQFDLHPEKIVFGHTHVSGIRWFFIDSQFGRFFGTGYIVSTNPPPFHQLFFIHTFLWAFLPWSLVYPVAIYYSLRYFKNHSTSERHASVILLSYFWISFIMFSLTEFQVDHYTNIIFPFAAILCARLILNLANTNHKIFVIQTGLSIIMLILVSIIIGLVFHGIALIGLVIIELLIVTYLIKNWGYPPFIKAILLPVIAITLTTIVYLNIGYLYKAYDPGINLAEISNQQQQIPIIDYAIDSRSLEFYALNDYYKVNDLKEIENIKGLKQFLIATKPENLSAISKAYPDSKLIATVYGNSPDKILPNLWSKERISNNLESFDIVLINNAKND